MSFPSETSDQALVDLLRRNEPLDVAQLATATNVTSTAVRQRLSRLMAQGVVQRQTIGCGDVKNLAATDKRSGRGRPKHQYSLTDKGRRQAGDNFFDLAMVLWQETRAITQPEVRRGLLQRLARRMADLYGGRLRGKSTEERMQAVVHTFAERNLPFVAGAVEAAAVRPRGAKTNENSAGIDVQPVETDAAGSTAGKGSPLPVLTALACPYPQLAEQDRGICAFERMVFSELFERDVKLSACRLDGDSCCQFQIH